jgi:molybdopterin molybdotransferase
MAAGEAGKRQNRAMAKGMSQQRPATGGIASGERWRMADATAWIDAQARALEPEDTPLAEARDRVLAETVAAPHDLPPAHRAALDGIAVRADDTAGASAYNPLVFRLIAPGAALAPGTGASLCAGDPLPAGADAIVPIELAAPAGHDGCEIVEPVAPGQGVERAGGHARRGAALVEAGQRLRPHHLGFLAEAGCAHLRVVRRPRVALLLARTPGAEDIDGPLLRALIERDGGLADGPRAVGRERAAIAEALRTARADVVLVAGGTGPGRDDHAAAALAEAGMLAAHCMALAPGDSAGFGHSAAGVPAFLLPGAPAACLWAYEMLAGRAVRRLGGRDPALPFPTRRLTAARKLVSAIGRTEIVAVRHAGDGAVEPAASFAEAGLAALARADGFTVVAEASEGVAAGATLTVYLYNDSEGGDAAPPSR